MNQDEQNTNPSNRAGVVGCTLSVIGFCLCGLPLLTIPGLIVSLVGLRREPKTAAIVGAVFGGLGLLELVLIVPLLIGIMLPAMSTARDVAREVEAKAQIRQIHSAMAMYEIDQGRAPKSFDELTAGQYIDPAMQTDPWNNKMHLHGDGTSHPTITSAGPDGVFDTEDDLSSDEDGIVRRKDEAEN